MMQRSKNSSSGDSVVGYGKPPLHTRFRKGASGNPGGRPRGVTAGRATALAIKEAYRRVTVREGDRFVTMPAIQAVLRAQVALAAKGNGPAQRALIDLMQVIERKHTMSTHEGDPRAELGAQLDAAIKRLRSGADARPCGSGS